MKVLHLTDLHVTEVEASLDTLWMGPRQVIGDQRFDAIIVSGDLTQRASKEEYEDLLQFTERSLVPLLPEGKQDRGRIVFVPGNHDIDWNVPVGEPAKPWQPWRRRDFHTAWEKHRQAPAHSPLRLDFTGPGTFDLHRVNLDSAQYRERYHACQREFLDRFYKSGEQKALVKPFKLAEVGEDWSVHQFADAEVAIFGFNSCHGNDRYWRAAHIDHRAIAKAASYWKQKLPNYQAIAVWHHGLTAEQGQPDFLTFDDLARLQEAGFQIGFHGHIHSANSWLLTQLRDDFVLIATGSLAAGKEDLQKGTGQQFSIAELHRSRVTVDVFERKGLGAQYVHNRDASRRFYLGSASTEDIAQRSERHVRTWSVDPNGILRGAVEITDLEVDGTLVLALLQPPFCNFEYAPADADGQPLKVKLERLPDGRQRLAITDLKERISKLTWRYTVSNAIALNQGELKLRRPVQRWYPNVPREFDVRSHLVRHDTDELVLRLEFRSALQEEGEPEESQPAMEEALPIVEEKVGDTEWIIARDEQKRCRFVLDKPEGRWAELRITAPVVGMRYGIRFRPKVKGPIYPSQARHLADSLLQRCRKQQESGELRQELTDSIRINVVDEMLGSEREQNLPPPSSTLLGAAGVWIGYIWDEEIRRLLPAFGEFTPEGWASRFAAGDGIAGHAFRQSGTAFWWKNKGRARLLFQATVAPNHQPVLVHSTEERSAPPLRYSWIVCVPLYFGPQGRSIGVVSFAGSESGTAVAKKLENLAFRFANLAPRRRDEVTAEDWDRHLHEKRELLHLRAKLENAVNFGFWQIIKDASTLEREDRSVAQHFFKTVKPELKKPR